jgi:hypothetical protein
MTSGARTDTGRATQGVLGLPGTVTAGLFDLEGVLTNTAAAHDRAKTAMFDAFLRERAGRADALGARGAESVVTDLAQLLDGGKGSVAR